MLRKAATVVVFVKAARLYSEQRIDLERKSSRHRLTVATMRGDAKAIHALEGEAFTREIFFI
jgi:hypothetical protein